MVSNNPERDAHICQMYQDGKTTAQIADMFGIKKQRIYQILRQAGQSIRPPKKSNRDVFLGINISESVKLALLQEATRRGISVSSMSSSMLKAMLIDLGYPVDQVLPNPLTPEDVVYDYPEEKP